MLETVDLKAEPISKDLYKQQSKELIERLTVLQQQCRTAGTPVVIVFEGWDAAGKGRSIGDLTVNLDARATTTWTINKPIGNEERRPFMERFWSRIGQYGTITIFDRSWYSRISHMLLEPDKDKQKHRRNVEFGRPKDMNGQPYGGSKREELATLFETVETFERQLHDDGYVIVKFFLHITKQEQRKRLKELDSKEETTWRVSEEDFERNKRYDELYKIVDKELERTSFDFAPWHIVSGMDARTANLQILQTLVDALEQGLEQWTAKNQLDKQELAQASREATAQDVRSRFPLVQVPSLQDVTYDNTLSDEDYSRELKEQRERLRRNSELAYIKRIPVLVAYEGWDAAGKGGNIKRLARCLDSRDYRVYPSSAPTPEELHHPFLWRYWTRLPKSGHFGIYDRTWYGRVLVERVEGFANADQWQRAYDEINEFEHELQLWGALLVKFWVDVSEDEQLRRFQDRQNDPAKQWKITDEDWRNRDKNPQYRTAINDMLRLTSTEYAPWHIIESDDKRFARVKAIKIVNEILEKRLND